MKRHTRILFMPQRSLLPVIAATVILAGCAGRPVKEEPQPPEPASAPGAAAVIVEAKLHASNNDFETASSLLENLIERETDNIEALRLLASVYAALGKRKESTAMWQRVSILDPTDSEASYEVGTYMARKGDWEGVRSKMLAAESNGAADGRHYLLLGEADLEIGYKGEAERYLRKAADLERARFLLGKLYYEQGRLGEAEDQFKKVLEQDPDNYSSHLHLGWLYFRKDDRENALKHYKNAVRLNPGDPLASLSLAALYEEMRRPFDAIRYFKDGLALPGIPPNEKKKAYNSLSRLLVENGRYIEAVSIIKEGLAEFPKAGGLYYQWGEALLGQGRKEAAVEKFKRAAEDSVWREAALRRIYSIKR